MSDNALIDELARLPSTEGYTAADRYHDFRRVLMGTDEGKRVLAEILSWARMFDRGIRRLGPGPIDPLGLALAEGQRNIALRLIATVYHEPKPQPDRAVSKPTRGTD